MSAKYASRVGVAQSVTPILGGQQKVAFAESSELVKVRKLSVSNPLFDVSDIEDEGHARGRKSNIVRLRCPVCENWRDALVLTTRGADSGARAMCATCDRERK